MTNQNKTKEDLIIELQELQHQFDSLKALYDKDINERKQAQELLQQTRQNYEAFFNTIDDFLFVLDQQGNIIHTNSTVINRLEYSAEELSGMSVLMVHPPERRAEAGRIVGEMLSGQTAFCPVPVITKSGVQIPVETRVSHGVWDGKPVIFGVTKDISKVKLSEEKFSKLFYINPSACGLSDLETRQYIEVNDAFFRLFGFEKNEVIGKTAVELGLFTPEYLQTIMAKAQNDGIFNNVEADLRAKNGDIKHVLLSAENIYVQNKKYRFTVVHDITEHKKNELEIEQQNQQLIKLNTDKDTFISILAHDLRSPFNAFLGLSSLLIKDIHKYDVDKIEEFLILINKSAQNTFNLLENLLSWARMQSGKLPFSPQKLNFLSICDEVFENMQMIAENKGISITYFSMDEIYVYADKNMITTVLRNLVLNAIKFSNTGGSVKIFAIKEPSEVTITVSDNGIGIEPENIGKLFDVSQKYSNPGTADEPGSGLGLSLCKEFVEKHGGKIWVESTVDKGSDFIFTLPITNSWFAQPTIL